jgi:hypothetical protein
METYLEILIKIVVEDIRDMEKKSTTFIEKL